MNDHEYIDAPENDELHAIPDGEFYGDDLPPGTFHSWVGEDDPNPPMRLPPTRPPERPARVS